MGLYRMALNGTGTPEEVQAIPDSGVNAVYRAAGALLVGSAGDSSR